MAMKPLLRIAEHYEAQKSFELAFLFAKMATETRLPNNDSEAEYYRHHLLGRISYYTQRYKDGRGACQKALEIKPDSEIDKFNLHFYSI